MTTAVVGPSFTDCFLADHYEDVFEIVDTFVHCMKAVSPATWQIFELIYQGVKDQSIDYMEGEQAPCANAYWTKAHPVVLL